MSGSSSPRLIVRFFTKPCCSLCVPPKHVIKKNQKRLGYLYREINIEEYPYFMERYGTEIPVVHVDVVPKGLDLEALDVSQWEELDRESTEFCRHRLVERDFVAHVERVKGEAMAKRDEL